jgi:hypothetical protein
MTYNPWSDYEDEERALYGLAEPMDYGGGASMPMPQFEPPPHAEMAPLNIDTGPDWSDALGAGTTALAALADLTLNKGKGTGQILAAGGQFGQARADQRLRQTQDALGYEQKRAQFAYDQSQRAGLEEIQRGNLAARNAELEEMRARRLGKDGGREGALEASQANLNEARAYQLWTQDPNALDPEAKARLDQQRELQTLNLDDRKAAREAAEAERAERAAERQQLQADRAQERKATVDDKTTREFAKDTDKTRSMAQQMSELDPILQKYEHGDIPGTGKVDRFIPNALQDYLGGNSEDATRIDQLKTGLQAEYRHAKTGAAASVPEDLRLAIVNGTRPDSTEQEFRLGMAALKKALPLQIRAYGAGREDQARAVLREQGLEDFVYGGSAGAPPPQVGPQQFNGAANYGPDADHPSNLGVGPGGRANGSVPKFSATPGGGAATARSGVMGPVGGMSSGSTGGVPMRTPSGNIGMVPPDRIQAAIAAGWKPAQ